MKGYNSIQDVYIKLISIWATKYSENPQVLITTLCNTKVPVSICNEIYKMLTSDGALQKLEDLKEKDKQHFYQYKAIVDASLETEKIKLYQAIHTVDFLSKNI